MVFRQRDRRLSNKERVAPVLGCHALGRSKMGDPKPSCRLNVIFAAASRKAIIFRHGPSKQTRLIAWDRASDTFEPGQWVRGTRVYDERSDISPDGAFLLLFLGTFRPPLRTYTVLSRPPFFTALALWPKGDTWGGGGFFVGSRRIMLDHTGSQSVPASGFAPPRGFTVDLADSSAPALLKRLEAHARLSLTWQKQDAGRIWEKPSRGGATLVATSRRRQLDYTLVSSTREVALPGAGWADIDTNGDIVFAISGALHRLRAGDIADAMTSPDVVPHASVLADFTDMRFENVVAPYASGGFPDDLSRPCPEDDQGRRGVGAGIFSPRLDRVTKEDRRRRALARKTKPAR